MLFTGSLTTVEIKTYAVLPNKLVIQDELFVNLEFAAPGCDRLTLGKGSDAAVLLCRRHGVNEIWLLFVRYFVGSKDKSVKLFDQALKNSK